MGTNRTKELLDSGKTAIGTFVFLRDAGVIDAAGFTGLDFVIIDCEHSGKSIETVENMVRAAESARVTSIARAPDTDPKTILQLLETGVEGIMVPCIATAMSAAQARAAIRFPPNGNRGTCRASRAAQYGMQMGALREYMDRANSNVLAIGSIENAEGVQNASAILEHGEFDVCLVGRGDLSTDLGFPGMAEHPEVERAVTEVERVARQASCQLGIGSYGLADAKRFIERGFNFIIFSSDTFMLLSAMQSSVKALRAMGDGGHGMPLSPNE